VTLKTDWFELREARLHLAPYTEPHLEIAVASVMTPAGVMPRVARLGVLRSRRTPGGPDALAVSGKSPRRPRPSTAEEDRRSAPRRERALADDDEERCGM